VKWGRVGEGSGVEWRGGRVREKWRKKVSDD